MKKLLFLLMLTSIASFVFAQITETFTSPGADTWIAPGGVTTITVELYGGGGCGDKGPWWYTNGGGGGGAYVQSTITVVPSTTYNLYVGAGSAPQSDLPGEDSWFIDATTAMAKGGDPGLQGPYESPGIGGNGGSAGASVGDNPYSGGDGDDGVWSFAGGYGGGGGSSAAPSSVGNSATNRFGAIAPPGGGNGGNGSTFSWMGNGNGSPGIAPGGGGGGGRNGNGGRGANGRIIISYSGALPFVTDLSILKTVTDPAAPPYYIGTLITFTIVVTNNGPDPATAIEVTDLLNTGYEYDSHTTTQGTYVPGTGIWTVGSLAYLGTATLTITAMIKDTGIYQNIATITGQGSDEGDPDVEDRESTINVEATEPEDVPLSNWALFIGIGLIVAFTVVRLRRVF